MVEKSVLVRNKTGLHARPASDFIREANKYKSNISIVKDNKRVDGKSILGLLSLGISVGSEIIIRAEGLDESEAVLTLTNLVQSFRE